MKTAAPRPARIPRGWTRPRSSPKPSPRNKWPPNNASAACWAWCPSPALARRTPVRRRRGNPPRLRTMKTPYVSELEPNQLVQGVFLVQHKEIRQKKTGEPYLSLTLADRSGDLDAKMWDNVPEVMDTFERDCFLKVKGMVQLFQNKPQLTIYRLQLLAETEIDIADFLPASKRDRDEMFAELKGWIASMANPHLKRSSIPS